MFFDKTISKQTPSPQNEKEQPRTQQLLDSPLTQKNNNEKSTGNVQQQQQINPQQETKKSSTENAKKENTGISENELFASSDFIQYQEQLPQDIIAFQNYVHNTLQTVKKHTWNQNYVEAYRLLSILQHIDNLNPNVNSLFELVFSGAKAQGIYEKGLSLFQDNNCLNALGYFFSVFESPFEARIHFKSHYCFSKLPEENTISLLKNIYQRIPKQNEFLDFQKKSESNFFLPLMYYADGDFESARQAMKTVSLDLSEKIQKVSEHLQNAYEALMLDDAPAAKIHFEFVRELDKTILDPSLAGWTKQHVEKHLIDLLTEMGNQFFSQKDFAKAFEYYYQGIKINSENMILKEQLKQLELMAEQWLLQIPIQSLENKDCEKLDLIQKITDEKSSVFQVAKRRFDSGCNQ